MGGSAEAAAAAYDASVDRYVELIGTEVTARIESPGDRRLLDDFARRVAGRGLVADVGCGPGRVTALLARAGVEVVGFDVSPGMLGAARAAHPALRFEEGRLDDLPVGDGALDGAICWYSIIYTPPSELAQAADELARVVTGGGELVLGFQAGDGTGHHRDDFQGTGLPLTTYAHDPARVADGLVAAGFDIRATTVREAELEHESTPQAHLVAQRRGPGA